MFNILKAAGRKGVEKEARKGLAESSVPWGVGFDRLVVCIFSSLSNPEGWICRVN